MEDPNLPQDAQAALDEIDQVLHQMLMLAELSAGEGNIERSNLQRVLKHLQRKINRAADRLDEIG
ncbi:MAG: hypothetical protein HFF57_03240 [Lawsonibacter sp.]|jgi:hypothetical protein|nr:hypothetical protein [Lawsonibacter sp.]